MRRGMCLRFTVSVRHKSRRPLPRINRCIVCNPPAGSVLEGAQPDSTRGRGAGEAPWLRSGDGSQLEPRALIHSLFPCARVFVPLRQLFGGCGWLGEISWGVSACPLIALAKGVGCPGAGGRNEIFPFSPQCSSLDDPLDAMPTPGKPWHPGSAGHGAGTGHFVAQRALCPGGWAVQCPGPIVPTCIWVPMGSAAWETHGLGMACAGLTCRGPLVRPELMLRHPWAAELWQSVLPLAKADVFFPPLGLCFV